MSHMFSTSSLVVVNGVCPIDLSVSHWDTARIVIGEVPDAIEFALNFDAVRTIAKALNTTLAEMAERRGRCHDDKPDDDPDKVEPAARVVGHGSNRDRAAS